MTIYLITIALINLALGYGLAVVLGHSLHGDFGRRWWQSSSVAADTWVPITPIGISQAIMAPEEEPTLPNEQTTESLSEFSAQLEHLSTTGRCRRHGARLRRDAASGHRDPVP